MLHCFLFKLAYPWDTQWLPSWKTAFLHKGAFSQNLVCWKCMCNGFYCYVKTNKTTKYSSRIIRRYTANVCRDLQGLYGEIGVRGFQIYGDCMYTRNPCNFWSKSKKVWTFYIYTLLRFFKFPYNFCGDFRRTCNPRDNYMHFTGYVLRHGDPPHFLWGKHLQCSNLT